MAAETREELKGFIIQIALSIQEGAKLIEVAEQLEKATGIADELASKSWPNHHVHQRARDLYFRSSDDRCGHELLSLPI